MFYSPKSLTTIQGVQLALHAPSVVLAQLPYLAVEVGPRQRAATFAAVALDHDAPPVSRFLHVSQQVARFLRPPYFGQGPRRCNQNPTAKNKPMTIISKNIQQAADILNQEELVAIPTETVYGLAGNIYSEKAVRQIFEMKNRVV